MNKSSKLYVSGHTGLVGSAVLRRLQAEGYKNVVVKTHAELDLMDPKAVKAFFKSEKPEYVINCAAKVEGIKSNMTYPAEFLYENLQIQNNVTWSAKEAGVKKFLFMGTSCIYPRQSPQPMKEEYFAQGAPEPTNEGYAYAKIVGMKLCEYIYDEFGMNFISCMPTNLYGPRDNFNTETSHVIPGLMRRMHEAKLSQTPEIVIWGTGNSRREFMHVDDLADAAVWIMETYDQKQFLNIGTGKDISIKELAEKLQKLVGYEGNLVFDPAKPDGMPRKLLDVSRLHEAGWHHKISFSDGLDNTFQWYLENIAS